MQSAHRTYRPRLTREHAQSACKRELRHVGQQFRCVLGQQLTLAYERKLFILTRNSVSEAAAGEHVEIYDYADGQLDIRWRGHSLPYSVFDKDQRVS